MKKIFKSTLAICLLLCMMFSLTACGGEDFYCLGETFVYDHAEASVAVSQGEKLEIEGLGLQYYGPTQFVFDYSGNVVWENTETHDVTLDGYWRLEDDNKTLYMFTDPSEDEEYTETFHVVGRKFYYVQQGENYDILIYFKPAQ